jgi:hypothetical protein
MTTVDFIITLFCQVDRHLQDVPKYPHVTLWAYRKFLSVALVRPYLSHAAQAEPAIAGSKGRPLTVASNSTGAGLRRAAMVKQVASAILMSWATRSGGSSLSSASSVFA